MEDWDLTRRLLSVFTGKPVGKIVSMERERTAEEKRETVMRMIALSFDTEMIRKITELSEEEIRKIREEMQS